MNEEEKVELSKAADISMANNTQDFVDAKRTAAVSTSNVTSLEKTAAIMPESTPLYNPIGSVPAQPASAPVEGVPNDMLNAVNEFMNGSVPAAPTAEPVVPTTPVAPVEPVAPAPEPVVPATPVAPVEPVVPASEPVVPATPVAPVEPVAPAPEPVVPATPVAPVEPMPEPMKPLPASSSMPEEDYDEEDLYDEVEDLRDMISSLHDYLDELDEKFDALESKLMQKKSAEKEEVATYQPEANSSFNPTGLTL